MMENKTISIHDEEFGTIRLIMIKNEPYFVARDVARCLGYSNLSDPVIRYVSNGDKFNTRISPSLKVPEMVVINESGLKDLISSSKMPSAKKFKHWVTSEVLPVVHGKRSDAKNNIKIDVMVSDSKENTTSQNNIQVFNNAELGSIRSLMIDNEPYFIAKDIAEILGYANPQKAVRDHVDEEDKLTERFVQSGQNREIIIINESGLYSLILSSKLPSAKKFKRWVTSEVLPSLRKSGSYQIEKKNTSVVPQTIDITPILDRMTALEEKINSLSGMMLQIEAPKQTFNSDAANIWRKDIANETICDVAAQFNGLTPEALKKIYEEMQSFGFSEKFAHNQFMNKYGADASTLQIIADDPLYQCYFTVAANRLIKRKNKPEQTIIEATKPENNSQVTEEKAEPISTIAVSMNDTFDTIVNTLAEFLGDNSPYKPQTLNKVYKRMHTPQGWKMLMTRNGCGNGPKKKLIEKNNKQKKIFVDICNEILSGNMT